MSKKYEIVISTSYAHKIIIEAENNDQAKEKANELSNDEVKEQAKSSWDVDGFPMIVEIEKTNA